MTPDGIQTVDGKLYELDIIILATGFDAGTGALTRIDIRGRGGRSLKEDWSRDIRTTMGLQVHGYPNLFTTATPLAPSAALCNMTTCLQQQTEWITDCIRYMRDHDLTVCEPTKEMEDRWVEHHDETANATLILKTVSWYLGSMSRVSRAASCLTPAASEPTGKNVRRWPPAATRASTCGDGADTYHSTVG